MSREPMEARPKEKSFWMLSFLTHVTRGLIRDRNTRRKTMLATLLAALLLLFAGATFLQPLLRPRPVWFILYWLACAWLTVLAMLLALFDLLMTRVQSRAAEKVLRAQHSETPDSPTRPDKE